MNHRDSFDPMSPLHSPSRNEPAMQMRDGVVINGCIPQDEYSLFIFESLRSGATRFDTLWESGEMPVLRCDDAFRRWRDEQVRYHDHLRRNRITCTWPWQVLKFMDPAQRRSTRLYWSQGRIGSCIGHADAFAHHSATLVAIACGAPLIYSPINPIVTWAMTKGGSLHGGQTVADMARGANRIGHFIEEMVGTDNQRMPAEWRRFETEAKQYQSAILFLDFRSEQLVDEIFLCCRAGLAIAFGNSEAVRGVRVDRNGVRVAELGGSWAHATHFVAYRQIGTTEYIGWINSHGPIYTAGSEGEPADMCWMDRATAMRFCESMPLYGAPYVVFPETPWREDESLRVTTRIPWPEHCVG